MEAWRRREDFRTEAAARRLTRSSHRSNVRRVPVRWSPHLRMMDEVARSAWNDLPTSIRELESEREAKRAIKKFVLEEQSSRDNSAETCCLCVPKRCINDVYFSF